MMRLIHNGSVGQGSPIEHQAKAQMVVEVTVEEEAEAEEAEDSQEQQETQMIEIMAQS